MDVKVFLTIFAVVFVAELSGCTNSPVEDTHSSAGAFTLAVIPDTQNYLSYKNQLSEGFAIDANDLFMAQMQSIADRSAARGGDIAFVASVGDVWQHQSLAIDPEHAARGLEAIPNPYFAAELAPTEKAVEEELPHAIAGYRLLAEAGLPFGVAPGNHDYDAMWSAAGYPPNLRIKPEELTFTPDKLGMLHIGGLDNFRSVFGNDSGFFKDRDWYVDSFRGGANSAQRFSAGGYAFLHITLEMVADDDVLAWAAGVIRANPGLPTIISTHDYLDTLGARRANPIVDLKRVDPDFHNTAEEVWDELVSQHDQVFLVLCGHHHGQSRRSDDNVFGHQVYQILADYQGRGQAGLDAGQPLHPQLKGPVGIGDGWYRLMKFHLGGDAPYIDVQTWSSHYRSHAGELATYSEWYKGDQYGDMSDAEFLATEEFRIDLVDFRTRFGLPK